jgi:hypothetical protein
MCLTAQRSELTCSEQDAYPCARRTRETGAPWACSEPDMGRDVYPARVGSRRRLLARSQCLIVIAPSMSVPCLT